MVTRPRVVSKGFQLKKIPIWKLGSSTFDKDEYKSQAKLVVDELEEVGIVIGGVVGKGSATSVVRTDSTMKCTSSHARPTSSST